MILQSFSGFSLFNQENKISTPSSKDDSQLCKNPTSALKTEI
jgi:hypothetical protein